MSLQIHLEHEDGVLRAQGWVKVAVDCPRPGPLQLAVHGQEVVDGQTKTVLDETQSQQVTQAGRSSFRFYLPASIPPTLTLSPQHARIHYTLTATLQDLTCTRPITIVGAPLCSSKDHPYVLPPKVLPVHTGWFQGSSHVVLAAKLDNQQVAKGKDLRIRLALSNPSNRTIDKVHLQLLERLQWGHHKEVLVELAELGDVQVPPLLHEEPHDDGLLHTALMDALQVAPPYVLPVPNTARDSYHGTLLHVSHVLRITSQHAVPLDLPFYVRDPPVAPKHVSAVDVTTVWPDDSPKVLYHHHHHTSNGSSCSSIPEVA